MKLIYSITFFFILQTFNCATIKEVIDCEENRDKDYPSAVSNCTQTQKEFNSKSDPKNTLPR
jgi:hypothetical protein